MTTEKKLIELGWGKSEAKWRANLIDAGRAKGQEPSAEYRTKSAVCELHNGTLAVVDWDAEGRMSQASPRVSGISVSRVLTRPFDWYGWDATVCGRLEDWKAIEKRDGRLVVGDVEYSTILAVALQLAATPALAEMMAKCKQIIAEYPTSRGARISEIMLDELAKNGVS